MATVVAGQDDGTQNYVDSSDVKETLPRRTRGDRGNLTSIEAAFWPEEVSCAPICQREQRNTHQINRQSLTAAPLGKLITNHPVKRGLPGWVGVSNNLHKERGLNATGVPIRIRHNTFSGGGFQNPATPSITAIILCLILPPIYGGQQGRKIPALYLDCHIYLDNCAQIWGIMDGPLLWCQVREWRQKDVFLQEESYVIDYSTRMMFM